MVVNRISKEQMTVQQLIDELQRNSSLEQQVFIADFADFPAISCARAYKLTSVQEYTVGKTKDGKCFVDGLGPEACVLFHTGE
jgi:hypothetical protein